MVTQLRSADGAIRFEVLSPNSLKEKELELRKGYVDAMKEYSKLKGDEKKQAAEPTRPALKRIKILNDKDEAAKLAAALQQKCDQQQNGKKN
ncbi:MAG: hypothetical protein AB1696_20335 [Planctomycetota bacterium]